MHYYVNFTDPVFDPAEVPTLFEWAGGLGHALPQIIAFAATFLQIGIMWANHHALFRLVDRVDQLLLLANLLLLAGVSFLPFPARLIAGYLAGPDARTAMLLYGGVLTVCAVAFNLIWHYATRRGLLHAGLDAAFHRDVTVRYRIGLAGYAASTLLALLTPWLTLAVNAAGTAVPAGTVTASGVPGQ